MSETTEAGRVQTRTLAGRALDAGERVILVVLFAWFVTNILTDFLATGNVFSLVLLGSESAVLVFVLIRRTTADITRSPVDWLVGFAGTTIPLLVIPAKQSLVPTAVVAVLMLGGAALQITAKLFLRRSFGIVAANRGIMAGGPYRLIRHPMYAGYVLTQLGFLLDNPSHWNLSVYCLCWAVQLARILVEERLLMGDPAYRGLVERVPYRLIPGIF